MALSTPQTVILGAGVAGLFTALNMPGHAVTVVSPAPLGVQASSGWAQGGIAAALGPGDSPAQHVTDTLAAGAGLSDPLMAEILAHEAAARIEDLCRLGVPFERDAKGAFLLGREAAHSHARIVQVTGDSAGAAVMDALISATRAAPHVTVREGWEAVEIATSNGQVTGVWLSNPAGELSFLSTSRLVMATGGSSALYAVTTNPLAIRGQGIGMAARAGAVIADAEFVQFHPTALAVGRDPVPLATEALRGKGAILLNQKGVRFLADLHPLAELAPRDVVSLAIHQQLQQGNRIFLDATCIGPAFSTLFPTVFSACMEAGIDPTRKPIPVAPAAHYHVGGVATDTHGCSTLAGLWVCGEVACTGVHGANRLASNSLLESLVMAYRVAQHVMESEQRIPLPSTMHPVPHHVPVFHPEQVLTLRGIMTGKVGIVRDRTGLEQAIEALADVGGEARFTPAPLWPEGTVPGRQFLRYTKADVSRPRLANLSLANMWLAAQLIAHSALMREESRGCHQRGDFPALSA